MIDVVLVPRLARQDDRERRRRVVAPAGSAPRVDVLAYDATKIIFLSSDRPAPTSNSSSFSSKIRSLVGAPTTWRQNLSDRLETASSVV